MKKCVVIGLGNFGMTISKTLMENDVEVLGIDTDKITVQEAKDSLTHAVIGNATNRVVIDSLGLKDFDAAVVSIGQEMAASILISLYLKEIGIERIVVRAISKDHEKILTMLGVSDIVFPERDMARRIGKTLSMKNTLDYLQITGDYAVLEVAPPNSFINKSLKELAVSSRYGCQILGIRYNEVVTDSFAGSSIVTKTKMAPSADDIIPEGSIIIVLGKQSDIEKIQSLD